MKTNLIHSDPSVMMGKPVIVGTRITVELLLEKMAVGETVDMILKSHPRLTRKAVLAAFAYAAECIRFHDRETALLQVFSVISPRQVRIRPKV